MIHTKMLPAATILTMAIIMYNRSSWSSMIEGEKEDDMSACDFFVSNVEGVIRLVDETFEDFSGGFLSFRGDNDDGEVVGENMWGEMVEVVVDGVVDGVVKEMVVDAEGVTSP